MLVFGLPKEVIPSDMDTLLNELKEANFSQDPQMADLVTNFSKERMPTPVIPTAGFVIKSRLLETKDEWKKDMKVFINICYSPQIPGRSQVLMVAPPLVSREEIIKAIQNDDSSKYKVPLSLSKPRSDVAKDAGVCLVFDACINSRPFSQTLEEYDFKVFIIELALA
jgi:hypothetical protein